MINFHQGLRIEILVDSFDTKTNDVLSTNTKDDKSIWTKNSVNI